MPVEQAWFAARADAQRQGAENLVEFYAEDVTLDHRALGPDVVRGRAESLRLIGRRWSPNVLVRQLQDDPFLSVDAALTHESLHVGGSGAIEQVVILTTFGPDSATSETLAVSGLCCRRTSTVRSGTDSDGPRTWTSAPEWGDRGVELAAETLAWGLMDRPYRVRRHLGTWSCTELADLFEVLTGSLPDPMPACPDGGSGRCVRDRSTR